MFSERYSMTLLVQSAYDHWPVTNVGGYINTDRRRLVHPDTSLLDAGGLFLDNYFRRLPVLRDGKPVGQVSRRDVLKAEHHLAKIAALDPGRGGDESGSSDDRREH